MKKKFFKNKVQMVCYIILFILFIIGFIYLGKKDYSVNNTLDNEIFASEYTEVPSDNIFTYIHAQEAYDYLKGSDILLLIGIKNNNSVGKYAQILNEIAKEKNIGHIYYYDIEEDRKNHNGIYESIVDYLEGYVTYLDNGQADLYAPTFIVKKDNVMLFFDDSAALLKETADVYWNNYNLNLKRIELNKVLDDYRGINE